MKISHVGQNSNSSELQLSNRNIKNQNDKPIEKN